MSHFGILVVTDVDGDKAVAEALAPFQENNMDDCPREYLEFNDVEDEHRKEWENDTVEVVRMPNGECFLNVYKQDMFEEMPEDIKDYIRNKCAIYSPEEFFDRPIILKVEQMPFTEFYGSFEEFMEGWGEYKKDEEKGRYGYWENPNSKWDWWSIGGRWSGSFKLKKGCEPGKACSRPGAFGNEETYDTDQARKGDIDWAALEASERIRLAGIWNEYEADDVDQTIAHFKYGIKKDETKDSFIRRCSKFQVYAILYKGEWHETDLDDIMSDIPDDAYLTMVDCHI